MKRRVTKTLRVGMAYRHTDERLGELMGGCWSVAISPSRFLAAPTGLCAFFATEKEAEDAYCAWNRRPAQVAPRSERGGRP